MGIAAKIGGRIRFVPSGGLWFHEDSTFISNGYVEVPEGVYHVTIYQSGGGGGGGVGNSKCSGSDNGDDEAVGGSGGSGYFNKYEIDVKPKDKIYAQIGSGGTGARYNEASWGSSYIRYRYDLSNSGRGGSTIVTLPNGTVITSEGGYGGNSNAGSSSGVSGSPTGGNGNAGGGGGCRAVFGDAKGRCGDGGRNGSNGGSSTYSSGGTGAGQNTTFANSEFNGGGAGYAPFYGNCRDWDDMYSGYAGVAGGGANVGASGTAHTGAGAGGTTGSAGRGGSGYVYMEWRRGGH